MSANSLTGNNRAQALIWFQRIDLVRDCCYKSRQGLLEIKTAIKIMASV